MAAPKRFFAERIGGEMLLPAEQSRHAKNVLRLTEGEEVTLFDGSGREYTAVVAEIGREGVRVRVVRESAFFSSVPSGIYIITLLPPPDRR